MSESSESAAGTPRNEPPSLAESESEAHGRIGYGRYARYTPIGLAAIIVLVLVAIGIWRNDRQPDPSHVGRLIGQPAPDFDLPLMDGGSVRLSSLRGSVVAVNFWGSWCAPCKTELPRFQSVAGDPSLGNVRILGIGIKNDYGENAKDLVKQLGLTFPIGRDTAGTDELKGTIELAYDISNYPTTVFIRPDGVISAIHIGELTEDQIRGYLDEAG